MAKKWKDILWPLGGTVLGLLAMPVAIAQYPDFFNNNQWLLPASVFVVVACWVVPLLLHKNAWNVYLWVERFLGRWLTIALSLVVVGIIVLGGYRLFRFHADHLRLAVAKASKTESPKL